MTTLLDPKVFADLQAKHGPDLTPFKLAGHVFVTRPLTAAEFQQVVDMATDPKKQNHTPKRVVELATVYPDADARALIFGRRPALVAKISDVVMAEAGANEEVELEKA